MKLEEAGALADRIVFDIAHLCDKIQVAGSIRRKRPTVHDIDIVLIPKAAWDWTTIISRLKNTMNMTVIRAGPELATLGFKDVDLPVDIYRARPATWGVLLLVRTGSKNHNIMLCSRAQRMGLMLSAKEGVIKDGKVIASRSEEEIFKALGQEFVDPEEREV